MLEIQRTATGMSESRAKEIKDFIEKGSDTRFCNVDNAHALSHLADMAYKTLDINPPSCLSELIQNASRHLGAKKQRIGLDIGPDRAKFLVNHLTGKEKDPRFRKDDTITKMREVLRKALATVAKGMEEGSGDDTTHSFMIQGNRLVDEKYPLN